MIIISNKPGQLGNLLFIYANFRAYGIDNNVTIINPAFHKYRSYFLGTSGFSLSGNSIVYALCYVFARILSRLKIKTGVINVIALDWNEHLDLETAAELKCKICFVQGWLFRSDRLLLKNQTLVRDFFSPVERLKNKTQKFFDRHFPSKDEVIVGIHIRHGDYKTFENGKYYYSTDQYLGIIKKLYQLFENKKPHFLICCNEAINFGDIDIQHLKITYAPGNELLDLYCLANCNYIAGPPSTYSMWASFYGKVPLCKISDVTKPLSLHDFKIDL